MAGSRGRRMGLSRAAILERAVELADESGVGAVTMRGLAAQLGVEAMTLYHYLPNKEALHDGMVEHVVTSTDVPWDAMPWTQALQTYATSLFAALRAHPGVIPLVATRPALTPRTVASLESALTVLSGVGIPPATGLFMVQTLTAVTVGHARLDAEGTDHGLREDALHVDPGAHPLLAEGLRGARPGRRMFDDLVATIVAGFAARWS
ncbi:TetR/AcrR family transcriptional regulator [Nocardiopsis halotolerans]|uniref:TetR/AcrR family transcriptional regulator n=1 Tax=Nocardiopsis halotolerans TaxID=124252 RepID=UPI0003459080|nr:TetR family transcriptional regulator [Nocardiopsis halotolerans]